jgi:SAM-dependent methyltransferase
MSRDDRELHDDPAAKQTSPGRKRARRLRVPIDAVPRLSDLPPLLAELASEDVEIDIPRVPEASSDLDVDLDLEIVSAPPSAPPPARINLNDTIREMPAIPWPPTPPRTTASASVADDDLDDLLDEGELLEPFSLKPASTSLPPIPPSMSDPNSGIVTEPPPRSPQAMEQLRVPPSSIPDELRRKRPRAWWDESFNDDYLRTCKMPNEAQVSRQCDFIEQSLGLIPGAKILDVGCGLGLQAAELAVRGYRVMALDLLPSMLSRTTSEAHSRLAELAASSDKPPHAPGSVETLQLDMRDLAFEGTFDAVLCLGTTFGYFDDEANRLLLERFRSALKPHGVLLLETVNRDYVLQDQPSMTWFEGDACLCMEETQFNYFTSRLLVKRTVILEDRRQRESEYAIRLYSLNELGHLLGQQGLRVIEVSGIEATPGVYFGGASPKLIVLSERRAQPVQAEPVSRPPLEPPRPSKEPIRDEATRRSSIPTKKNPNPGELE